MWTKFTVSNLIVNAIFICEFQWNRVWSFNIYISCKGTSSLSIISPVFCFQGLVQHCDKLQETKADKEYVQMEVDVVSIFFGSKVNETQL